MSGPAILHAGLIALRFGGAWRGALVTGPSGSGKSDLALRALAEGFRLAADDRTIVFASGGRLFGRAPKPLEGLLEARGVGVLASVFLPLAEIILAVECIGEAVEPERIRPLTAKTVGPLDVPVLRLWPLAASAPAKLRHVLGRLGSQRQPAYQAALRTSPRAEEPGVEENPLRQP